MSAARAVGGETGVSISLFRCQVLVVNLVARLSPRAPATRFFYDVNGPEVCLRCVPVLELVQLKIYKL